MHADVFHQLAHYLKKHRRDTIEVHQRFGAAAPLKIGHCVLLKNHKIQTGLSKKLHMQKTGPYEIIELPTDVTYKIKHKETGEEITSHRNNLISFTPKTLVLGSLVDKYYKRPHIPSPLSSDIENEPPAPKSVRFGSEESQNFHPQDEPVIIESNTTDYFDSSPNQSSSFPEHSEPLKAITPNIYRNGFSLKLIILQTLQPVSSIRKLLILWTLT